MHWLTSNNRAIVEVMIIRYKLYIGSYLNIIVNRDTTGRHHQATIHDNDMAANLHLMGTNDSKRDSHDCLLPYPGKDGEAIHHRLSKL